MNPRLSLSIFISLLLLMGMAPPPRAPAAQPTRIGGFSRVVHTLGLTEPTAFAFKGQRIFVAERGGVVRIVNADGTLRPKPYLTLNVSTDLERGLLGIAVDPKFHKNRFVYVYYTTAPGAKDYADTPLNRVSRFKTKNGVGIKEKILVDKIPSDTGFHNAGDLHFGSDGKLYVAVGDGGHYWGLVPKLDNLRGKILRLNRTGSAPRDNPFYNTPNAIRSIYAFGFRNPFRLAPRPSNATILVGDVGRSTWEELDELAPGKDYGWARYEGPCTLETPECDPAGTDFGATTPPLYYYKHNGSGEQGGAIIAGAFPHNSNYPEPYADALFYGDWLSGWVHVLPLDANNTPGAWQDFDALVAPIAFATGPDGNVYVADIASGILFKYVYTGQ